MIVVHFAKQSINPLHNAIFRLLVGFGGAVGLGLIVSGAVKHATLPLDLPLSMLMSMALAVGFIIGGFVILAISSSQSAAQKGTVFQRVVKVMPLSKFTRWILCILPSILVIFILGVFGSIVIYSASKVMMAQWLPISLAWMVGLFCGFGCIILSQPKSTVLKGLLFMTIVAVLLLIFDKILNAQTDTARTNLLRILNVIILFPLIGFFQAYQKGELISSYRQNATEVPLIPKVLPVGAWFLVKLWRNRRTRGSLLLASVLSTTTAVSIILRHKVFEEPYGLLLFGAILAATFACDVRGVMRRNIPPEMVLLNGTRGIVKAEIWAVTFCGILIGLPMLVALNSSVDNPILFIVFFVAIQNFASLAGLLASTIFVPGAGDTGSQFFAAVLASTAVITLPKIGHFSDVTYNSQSMYWIVASFIFGLAIYLTELYRRKNYGHA